MVQVTIFALVVAVIIFPVLAAPVMESRDYSGENYQSYHHDLVVKHSRPYIREEGMVYLPTRYFDDVHIDIRGIPQVKNIPKEKSGTIFKVVKNSISKGKVDLAVRDLKCKKLETRKPTELNRRAHYVIHNAVPTPTSNASKYQRSTELSGLDARRVNFGKVFRTVGKIASNFIHEDAMDTLEEREFDNIALYSYSRELKPTRTGTISCGALRQVVDVGKHFIRDEETGAIYVIREARAIDGFD